MSTDNATIARVARRAAEVIEANGWTRDAFLAHSMTDTGHDRVPTRQLPCCASGAIRIAAIELGPPPADPRDDDLSLIEDEPPPLAVAVETALAGWLLDRHHLAQDELAEAETGGCPSGVIAVWQDADGRTAGEITTRLREFAEHQKRSPQ